MYVWMDDASINRETLVISNFCLRFSSELIPLFEKIGTGDAKWTVFNNVKHRRLLFQADALPQSQKLVYIRRRFFYAFVEAGSNLFIVSYYLKIRPSIWRSITK